MILFLFYLFLKVLQSVYQLECLFLNTCIGSDEDGNDKNGELVHKIGRQEFDIFFSSKRNRNVSVNDDGNFVCIFPTIHLLRCSGIKYYFKNPIFQKILFI